MVNFRPAPKGSWRPMPIPKKGMKGSIFKADYVTRMLPNNRHSEPFAQAVAAGARGAWKGGTIERSIGVMIYVCFMFIRPDCHFKKKAGKTDRTRLRPDAPAFPIQANQYGDIDKLERNILDAMKGIVYDDDAQVVAIKSRKIFRPDPQNGADAAMIKLTDVMTVEELTSEEWGG